MTEIRSRAEGLGQLLLGRHAEIATIHDALETARRGTGALVTVWGAPGLGKTRVLVEAASLGRRAAMEVVWASGWTGGGSPSLWPWHDVVDQLAPGGSAAIGPVGEDEQFETFRRVAGVVVPPPGSRARVVLLDDAHLFDPDALQLLRFVVRAGRNAPIAFVITVDDHHRPVSDGQTQPRPWDLVDAIGRDGLRVRLEPLDRRDVDEAVAHLAGRSLPDFSAELHELTGGVPLLVDEVLTVHGVSAHVTELGLTSILEARLRGLDGAQRRVLAAAALLGRFADNQSVAATTGLDARAIASARSVAAGAGLLGDSETDHRLTHERFASAVLGTVDRDELDEMRRRTALHLEATRRPGDQRVVAAADQWQQLARSTGSPADRGEARRCTLDAATSLAVIDAHGAAAALLAAVIELADDVGEPVDDLVLEAAARQALDSGDLRSARQWNHRIIDQSVDPTVRARALLGFGGIWVHEHRDATTFEWFLELLRAAISSLPDDHALLRARLAARLAAEEVYAGRAPVDAIRDAVGAVIAHGDSGATAGALSLLHHCILGPSDAEERRRVAHEMIRAASSSGDAVSVLLALLWRAVDQRLAGDPHAQRALTEVHDRAGSVHVEAVEFVLAAIAVGDLVRAGALDAAEEAADACFELGMRVGDSDALTYYGAHLMAIRWLQGRSAEILPLARQVADSPALVNGVDVFLAAIAALAADAGRLEEAESLLDHLLRDGVEHRPETSNTLVVAFCLAEAAATLHHHDAAKTALRMLTPHAELPLTGSLGVACFGPAARSLGLAAGVTGDLDAAVHHLADAVRGSIRLGNLPMAAIARADLGAALLERGEPDDVDTGLGHIRRAVTDLDALGLTARADHWRQYVEAATLSGRSLLGTVTIGGGRCRLGWSGHEVDLDDGVGIRRIVQLLRNPGVEIPAADLAGVGTDPVTHEVVDRHALDEYRRRISELQREIDDADADHDLVRAERLRVELDAVLDEVARVTGLGDRLRGFGDSTERARIAVRASIRRSIHRIQSIDSEIGTLLADSIHTGTVCSFDPVAGVPRRWVTRSVPAE